jgi:hypothetical protein
VRVPSSKALYKHHNTSSATKLNRRHTSPSPDRAAIDAIVGGTTTAATELAASAGRHRRVVSDPRLSRNSSAASLVAGKKNLSQTNLAGKRNRSHAELAAKRNKSSGQLKRPSSSPNVLKLTAAKGAATGAKTQVHFDLGTEAPDADNDEEGEGEWVDASNSASPYLSRRGSVIGSGQSSAKPSSSAAPSEPGTPARGTAVQAKIDATEQAKRPESRRTIELPISSPDKAATAHYNEAITARLLQRTTSHNAPPMMSTEVASVRPPSSQQHSPDSGGSRASTSTYSNVNTPAATSAAGTTQTDSGHKDMLTSRFITNDTSQMSSLNRDGSFYNPQAQNGVYVNSQPNGRFDVPRRPRSAENLAKENRKATRRSGRSRKENGQSQSSEDEQSRGESGGLASNARHRRSGGFAAPRADLSSRTQQKIDLQRASSNLEPPQHPGFGNGIEGIPVAAGPLLGISGFDNRDPRIVKLLEKAEMEYLVVRRYQNPVARSIARISQLPSAKRSRHIPRSSTELSTPTDRRSGYHGHAKRSSDANDSLRRGVSSRDAEHRDYMHSSRRPATAGQNGSSIYANGAGSSIETDDGGGLGRLHHEQRLSGSSLIDNGRGAGTGDDATMVILRNMWEKSMDFQSASQD